MGLYNSDSGLFTMQEFKNRGIIKLGPDVLVFISGNFGTAVVAPVSGQNQRVDFKDGVQAVSVQNVIDPPGSSTATIEMVTPLYDIQSNYWIAITQGTVNPQQFYYSYFVPMMEVKIFFKGRYLVNGQPAYYPSFWGFILNVEETFSGGVFKLTLQCADMLHWWTYIQVAYHPSTQSDIVAEHQQGLTVFPSRYLYANAFEIIYSLVKNCDMSNFITPQWLGKSTPLDQILSPLDLRATWFNILSYWNKRFQNLASYLRMYGASGNSIVPQISSQVSQAASTVISPGSQTFDANNPGGASNNNAFTPDIGTLVGYGVDDKNYSGRTGILFQFEHMGHLDQAEYFSRLEIATQIKTLVQYEFYQDVDGCFIFKPPFYNLNTAGVMAYRLEPGELRSYAANINSEEIVTSLEIVSSPFLAIQKDDWVNKIAYFVDIDLTNRFGERHKSVPLWYLSGNDMATQWTVAAGQMSFINVKAFNATVVIPGRPEIKLGYPVYIVHKDCFYYPTSINHTFEAGGEFVTSLSLNGQRPRIYDIIDGQWQIRPNLIYMANSTVGVTTKLPNGQTQTVYNYEAIPPGETIDESLTTQQRILGALDNNSTLIAQQSRAAGMVQSTATGKYNLIPISAAPKTSPLQANLVGPPAPVDRTTLQSDSVPYTDENGYRVIGAFKYGRDIQLNSVEGFEINQPLPQGYTPNPVASQASTVTNAVAYSSGAEQEGVIMGAYQSAATGRRPIAGLIPAPLNLDSLAQNISPASAAQLVTNGASYSGGSVSSVPLVNTPQTYPETMGA
jgi:hypothetical protein